MKNFFKYSKELLKRNGKALCSGIILVLVLTAIQAFLPVSMRRIISEVEKKQSISFLAICILIYALFLLIYNLVDVAWTKFLDKLGGKILENIREDLYKAIWESDYEKIMVIGKEKLKNILYMDTLNMFSAIACHSVQILANILLIIVFLAVSACINYKLTLALLVATVIGFILSMVSRKPISNASMKVNKKMKDDNKTLNEYVDALELVKTNDVGEYFIEKSHKSLWNFINTSLKADNVLVFLKNTISGFHQIISMAIAAVLSMTMGSSTMGDLVFYLFVADMVLDTSRQMESAIYSLMKLIPSFENVDKILNLEKGHGTKNIDSIENIEFKNVDFYYERNNNMIIKNKNEVFIKGDVVQVTGVNGGGKSTFVKLIAGLLKAKNGQILINGIPSNELSSDCLKKHLVYIDQDEIILNDNVKTYVETVAGRKISQEELTELQEKVGFDSSITEVLENGRSLSGGQRKKLLMMKLLLKYKTASVIILDEIEAGLDIETKNKVLQLEKEIIEDKKECIFFKITHEAEEDKIFNRKISV